MRRRAFTLIEVTLVVLLLSLLAGAAAMSFARPLRAARAREAIAELSAFDAAARQLARRSGQDVEMTIDPYEQQVTQGQRALRLPNGLRIDQVRDASDSGGSSQLTVRISSHGWSRSYAVRIKGPEFDRWLLIAGMSGQVSVVENEATVESILAASARRDAD